MNAQKKTEPSIKPVNWRGLFPAMVTVMDTSGNIDMSANLKLLNHLQLSGCCGVIILGPLGENQSLSTKEKLQFTKALVEHVDGAIPVLSGVIEHTTEAAIAYVTELKKIGADGYMLPPPVMDYGSSEETLQYLRDVTMSSSLPVMIDTHSKISSDMLGELADIPQIQAINLSTDDTRFITQVHRLCKTRYRLFTGCDNLALESFVLGLDGWVDGSAMAFQMETQCLWELMIAGRYEEALELYRWLSPLFDLIGVRSAKLALNAVGLSHVHARKPRLPLKGKRLKSILSSIHKCQKECPDLKTYGWSGVGSIAPSYMTNFSLKRPKKAEKKASK